MTPLTPQEQADVERWLPLVQKLAARLCHHRPTLDQDDAIHDGVFGLVQALRRFDATRGIKFETFATTRIRGAMVDRARTTLWPRVLRAQRRALQQTRDRLTVTLQRDPTTEEIADALHIPVAAVSRTRARIAHCEARGVDPSCVAVWPALEGVRLPGQQRRIRAAVHQLPARLRRVLALYYGDGHTLKAVAEQIGVKESRASQLLQAALRALRVALEAPAIPPRRYRARHREVSCAA